MTTSETQQRLDEALTRLLTGQPARTDGRLTVANLCLEAGVGRDSFYRSPAIRARFTQSRANHEGHQPELIRLREQLRTQQAETGTAARRYAEAVRLLEQTITSYANQIQTLALRAAELADENEQLRNQLAHRQAVRTLSTRPEPRTTPHR
jgi:uncharacterized membrane-anchored protein YhcB (DUF1043 family)